MIVAVIDNAADTMDFAEKIKVRCLGLGLGLELGLGLKVRVRVDLLYYMKLNLTAQRSTVMLCNAVL